MFEERLKSLRNEHHMAQKMLAEKLFVSQQAVAKWENPESKASPNPDTIKKIADFFDVSIDYLLGKTDIKKAPSDEDAGLSAEEAELIELFRNASPALQDAALRVLEADQKKESS